jgi:hypothetical protein
MAHSVSSSVASQLDSYHWKLVDTVVFDAGEDRKEREIAAAIKCIEENLKKNPSITVSTTGQQLTTQPHIDLRYLFSRQKRIFWNAPTQIL